MRIAATSVNVPSFLSLEHASFRLGDRLVFENTSWQFNAKQHWGIVGPNGSGKSFFGEALAGHLPLVHGEMTWHFKPPGGLPAGDCIAHVAFEDRKQFARGRVMQSRWQTFEQDYALTVREALSYERVMEVNPFEVTDRHQREKARFDTRQRQAIKLLRIENLLDRKLLILSNGEMQKMHLARALSRPLRLLILDEPATGLDARSRAEFHSTLGRLMSGGLRVIVIAADPASLPIGITHLMYVDDFRIMRTEPFRRARMKLRKAAAGARRRIYNGSHITPSHVGGHKKSAELVRMKNVTVRYGSNTILASVNWTICRGESWALLGPNGSGKTTLLSLIVGDHPQAFSNDIVVLGRRFGQGESIWDLKRKIGMVSPELHLHFPDSFTCLEVVESGFRETSGLYEDMPEHERRMAMRWLARFDLKPLAHKPLYELSAGQQRAALLARALVKDPALLILDEPCQGLDTAHRKAFLRKLDGLISDGKITAIYVTHDEAEIPASICQVMRL